MMNDANSLLKFESTKIVMHIVADRIMIQIIRIYFQYKCNSRFKANEKKNVNGNILSYLHVFKPLNVQVEKC